VKETHTSRDLKYSRSGTVNRFVSKGKDCHFFRERKVKKRGWWTVIPHIYSSSSKRYVRDPIPFVALTVAVTPL
jgi:hypothetical protein